MASSNVVPFPVKDDVEAHLIQLPLSMLYALWLAAKDADDLDMTLQIENAVLILHGR